MRALGALDLASLAAAPPCPFNSCPSSWASAASRRARFLPSERDRCAHRRDLAALMRPAMRKVVRWWPPIAKPHLISSEIFSPRVSDRFRRIVGSIPVCRTLRVALHAPVLPPSIISHRLSLFSFSFAENPFARFCSA